MGALGIRTGIAAGALALLTGCGEASPPNGTEFPTDGRAGTGGGGSTGEGATSGTGGVNGEPPGWELADVKLDDTFLWFIQAHGGPFEGVGPAVGGVVHVLREGSPVEATVSTHHHVDIASLADGVTFRAKASRELPLRVSVHASLDTDYFGALDAGRTWPTALTPVTPEWATFEVPFSALQPPEQREPGAAPAFTIAFVIEAESGPVELWLDDVHFF